MSSNYAVSSNVSGNYSESLHAASCVRWKMFFLMLVLVTINYIDRSSISIAMPIISKEFNIDHTVQGLILGAFFWTYSLMQIPGGWLADKYGARKVIAFATIAWGAFQALCGLATGWIAMYLARLGLGVSEAPILPAGGRLNRVWMTRTERSRGATLMNAGGELGSALGALVISGLIVLTGSWRYAFIIAGVGSVIAGLFAWRYIKNNPREHRGVNEAEAALIEDSRKEELASDPEDSGRPWYYLFKHRAVWGLVFGWFSRNTIVYGIMTWAPIYLSEKRGFDIKQMGGAIFLIFIIGFVGELVAGYVADRWLKKGAHPRVVISTILGIASLAATISILAVTRVSSPALAVTVLCITMFFIAMSGLYWSIPSIVGTQRTVGTIGGIMNLGGNIAGVIIPVVTGLIVQLTGSYYWAFILYALGGAGFFVCSVLVVDYRKKLSL
jgi:ACS family D-galactonate transporter-like MFS transporter